MLVSPHSESVRNYIRTLKLEFIIYVVIKIEHHSKIRKLEIIKAYWGCEGNFTVAKRLLHKKENSLFKNLNDKSMIGLVLKLENDFTLEDK